MKKLILTLSVVLFSTLTFSQTFPVETLFILENDLIIEEIEVDKLFYKAVDVRIDKDVVYLTFLDRDNQVLSKEVVSIESYDNLNNNRTIRGKSESNRHVVITFTAYEELIIERGKSYKTFDFEESIFFFASVN